MTSGAKASYAATAGGSQNQSPNQLAAPQPGQLHGHVHPSQTSPRHPQASNPPESSKPQKYQTSEGPSPDHIPKTASAEEDVYVLTFLTDQKHHRELTALRTKYFPPKLNRLEAHLTLFHALPGSKLQDLIIPTLENVSRETRSFHLLASTPFKLKRGIAIGVPKSAGGDAAREIHGHLKQAWQPFLSDQDAGGFAAHYTVMNKVDDEAAVNSAFSEISEGFRASSGQVRGLSLWRYVKSRWEHHRDFEFQK